MGLCKCPKKVVTTLFCYEHRVNVCESCLVSNHPSCIVQSYYKWLQDSEYDSACTICSEELSLHETVRLTCFHVFHWKCFKRVIGGYPETTAPAGYRCPICSETIFPSPQSASPVAIELRTKFASLSWCKNVIDSDLREQVYRQQDSFKNKLNLVEADHQKVEPMLHVEQSSTRNARTSLDFNLASNQHRNLGPVLSTSLYTIEEDARKYRRRRPMTLRQSLNYLRRSPYFKFIFLIFFTLFVLCVLFATVIPTEFEDEKAFKRIVELKQRADESRLKMEILDGQ